MATTTAGPTQTAKTEVETGRWAASKWISRVLRAVIFLAPFVISILLSFWASRNYPPERLGVNRWLWWIGLIVIATVVVRLIEKLLARLTPITMLFRLSLVFPDQAPSRFSVVLKAGSPRAVQRRLDEIEANGLAFTKDDTYAAQMLELISLLSAHDRMTRGHAERVRAYSELIGEEMGLEEDELAKLRWGALLHDMGKLDVPSEILNKPSRPTDEEWKILQNHPAAAAEYLEPLALWLGEWRHAATGHHERWDGGGYPLGLAGEEIPLSARIVGVADAFDVMTSTRSYKSAMSLDLGRQEVADKAGTQFDPAVARAFLRVSLGDLRRISGPLAWFAGLPGLQNIPVGSIASSATTVATGVSAVTLGVTAPFVDNAPPVDPPSPPPAVGFIAEAPELEIIAPPITEDSSGTIELTILGDTPTTITIALGNPPATVEASTSEDRLSHELLVTPDANYSGTFPVTVEVCNESALCTSETIDVTVVPANDPPEIAFGRLTIEDNTTARLDITDVNGGAAVASDALPIYVRDIDGDVVRLVGVEDVTGGFASHTDASIEFTHDPASTAQPALTAVFSDGTTTVRRRIALDLIITNVAPNISPRSFSIAENTGIGVLIGTVAATDDDGDAITFSLDPPIADIVINPLTGELTAAVSLNHEARSSYTVTVVATDPRGSSTSAAMSIAVTDIPEPLAFGPLPTLAISEEATAGTPIGTVTASDPDGTAVTFSGTAAGPFAIDSASGLITATSPPPVGTTTIVVTATSADGESISVSIPISVADVNHAPVITAPNFTLLVNEVTPIGTDLGSMSATDSDGDAVTYAVIGGDSPTVVSIDSGTGRIVLAEPLDYELKTLHTVLVRATDNGSPSLSATKEVRIGVVDTNETPIFGAIPSLSLPEIATPVGATIATLTASDPEGGAVTFAGIDPTGSLSVAPDGTITVASGLDFETNPTISLSVVAKDPEGGSTTDLMTIVIADENEPPAFDTANAVVTAVEGTAPGTFMSSGAATDPDAGDVISYRIVSGNTGSTFAIDPSTGAVTLVGALDFEAVSSYTLTLGARDAVVESTTELKINVGPIDEPPTISAPAAFADQNENTVGVIETIIASDPEGDPFTFAIDSGDPGGLFAINPTTGVLSVVGVLDYETTTLHSLVIGVTQDSDPTLNDAIAFDLNVLPVNEAPVFDTPNVTVFPLETTPGGTAIGSGSATDPDVGASIVYRIISGDPGGDFTIDPSTGVIATAATTVLDKETTPTYSLVIGADDGAIESTTSFTVNVDDVDEAPVITAPAAFTPRPEDQAPGVLESISASDPESDAITFTIDSGDPGGLFALDPTTGALSLVGALDFETVTSHTLVISATQTDDATLFDTKTFILVVDPVDEVPILTIPTLELEESAADPVVGVIGAVDEEGETLSFTISDPKFTIDATGTIRAVDTTMFDFETPPTSYPMTVTVTDQADPVAQSVSQAIAIVITDANEAPVVTAGQSYTVVEDDPNAPISVIPVDTSDEDGGDSIASYAITGGTGIGLFTIDGSGIISKAGALDFNTVQSYDLEITVTDSGGLTGVDTITIVVESRFGPNLSPFAGQVIINEVMYRNGGTPDWIELVNVSGSPINIAGWTLSDSEDGSENFTMTIVGPPIAPGDHAVLQAPGVEFDHVDDIWIFDDSGLLVAYMAWGDETDAASAILSRPPLAVWPIWEPTHEIELGTVGSQQSISLSPDAGSARESRCWEVTTTGTATGRCPDALVTLDTTGGASISSRFEANTHSPGLVVSELAVDGMYSGGDFIEIYNASGSPQPLAGINVELVHTGGSDIVDLGAISPSLAPGQHILLAEAGSALDPIADALLTSATIDPEFGVRILDTGSGLTLDQVGNAEDLDAGFVASIYREGIGLPNPIAAGGYDLSFERRNGFGAGNCVDTNDNVADFIRNMAVGTVNPESLSDPVIGCGTHVVPGPADHIVISEFRTNGPNGGGDEFIELFNPHTAPIDVSSLKFFADGSEEYAFPAASLQPGEHWLIAGPSYLGPRDGVHGGLSNGTNLLELWDGATLVDQILIDSGPGSVPKPSDTDAGTVQRSEGGCADYAQPDLNYQWGTAPTPQTSGPPFAPCS